MDDLPPKKSGLPSESNEQKPNMWRQIGHYTHLGFILPASVIVGYLIGAALDRWLHTSWISVVGLLIGCVAGFTELIREMLKASKES
jgi:F0F1-type ATP synthase assembly protein I